MNKRVLQVRKGLGKLNPMRFVTELKDLRVSDKKKTTLIKLLNEKKTELNKVIKDITVENLNWSTSYNKLLKEHSTLKGVSTRSKNNLDSLKARYNTIEFNLVKVKGILKEINELTK